MNILAYIPARKGSKGVLNKNMRPFCGRPLVAWTIEAAMQAKEVSEVAVSSDDEETLTLASSMGVQAWKRPVEYAGDTSSIEEGLAYHLGVLAELPKTVVLLQPTSPLRRAEDIDHAIAHYQQAHAHSLLSLVDGGHPFYWTRDTALRWVKPYMRRPNRQDMPLSWQENGAIYIFDTRGFVTFRDRLFGTIAAFGMEPWQRFEVDSLVDWEVCEALMEKHILKGRS